MTKETLCSIVMETKFGLRLHDEPMTGAAGGLGAGIKTFLNGKLLRGAPQISKLIGLEVAIENSDLVITGEGRFDSQTLSGKAVAEVLALAKTAGKKVWGVFGEILDKEAAKSLGFEKIFELSPTKVPKKDALISYITDQFSSVDI